jgi:hypothetical protein
VTSIALLGADTTFGRRVEQVLRQIEAEGGPSVYDAAFYAPNDYNAATLAIEDLALGRAERPGARGGLNPELDEDAPPAPRPEVDLFQALFISDTGAALRELSSVLQGNALSASDLLVLGPDSWRSDAVAMRLFALRGAVVAGPDQTERANFAAAYSAAYDSEPGQLASLAYDAVALAAQLRGDESDWDVLESRSGYMGADGLFRLPPGGVAERGLALYQMGPAGFFVIEPAPDRFDLGF